MVFCRNKLYKLINPPSEHKWEFKCWADFVRSQFQTQPSPGDSRERRDYDRKGWDADVLCTEHELLIPSALRAQPARVVKITEGIKGQVHLLFLQHKPQREKSWYKQEWYHSKHSSPIGRRRSRGINRFTLSSLQHVKTQHIHTRVR